MKLKKPRKEEVKILIIDDETIVALDIKNTLEKYGYSVIGIASNAMEAIDSAKTSKPNLILMDIMLKGSKDGIEVSSEINKFADIPIIFLTAYSDDHTLERAKKVEPYGYLIKPFDNRELFTTIEMALYKHSMELSVRESEESLSITLNSIGDAVISTDENGLVVRMNPAAEKLTGWKFDETKGLPLEKIFHLIDATTRNSIPNPVEKVIKSGNVIGLSNHTILISRDGKEINISDSAAPIRDDKGNIKGVVLVFSDVTETYKAREEIVASEEKFRLLITQMHQGMAVHEVIYNKKGDVVDYRFIEVNESFERITGLKRENILGKTVLEVMPDTEKYWIEKYGEVVKTGTPLSYENYSGELKKYFEVVAYRNRPDQFAVIVSDITERKIAEEELRIKDQAIASSINAIALADLKGNLSYVNNSFLELWGYKSINEVLGRSAIEFWQNMNDAKFVSESVKEKGRYIGELKAKRKDGKLLDLFLTSTLVYGADGKPVQIMASFVDVTDRNMAEERTRLMADLLDLSPASVIVHDLKGDIIYVNKRSLELHGYTEKQFLKLNLRDIDTPESAELIEKRIAEINRNGELTFEVSHRRKDGSSFPLLVHTKKTKWGGKEVLLSISNDITEQKQQQEILRQKTEELDNYFTNALDLFCIANTDGYFVRLNKQWENVLGYSLSELEGKKFLEFVHPDDLTATLEAISILDSQKKLIGFTNRYRAKDGSYKFIEWRSYPAGERIYAAARDITERKKAEDALRESEERYKSFMGSTDDLAFVKDEYLRYMVTNSVFDNHIHKKTEEIIGKTDSELLPPEGAESCMNTDLRAINENRLIIAEETVGDKIYETRKFPIHFRNGSVGVGGFIRDITEKKRADEALKKSEERFALVIDASEQGIWDWNILTNQVYYSPQWKKIIGYNDHELENDFNVWIEHLHPDEKENCLNAVQSYLENPGEHFILEFRFRHKDGSYRWIHNKAASILDKDGKVVRMFGSHLDITDRKIAEEALKQSESKFRSLISSLNDIVYTLDTEQRHTGVYGDWVQKAGLTPEFFIGKKACDMFNPEAAKAHEEANIQVLEGKSVVYEWNIENDSDIKFYQTSITPLRDSNGQIIGIVGVARDITSLKNALEALEKSEFYLKKSQQVARIGSYLYDIKNGTWVCSESLDEIFGIDGNFEKTKEGWISLIHPEFKQIMIDHLVNHVIHGKNRFDKEYKIIRVLDGTEIWVHGNGELEYDQEGNPTVMVGTIQDISERKLAEAALKESEKKFRSLFDTMPNGYYRSTPEGYFVDANPAFIKMLGYDNLEDLKKVYIPRDIFVQSSEREKILTNNPDFISDIETYRLRTKDGRIIWIEDNARYIKDNNGNVIFNEGICKDITDRKKAEDALRESEQLFTTLAQVSPVGIFRTDPDGYTTYVNPTWTRLAGIAAEKAMGDGWLAAVHPDERDKLSKGWIDASGKQDVSVAEYRFLRPDGNIVWVMGQAIPEFTPDNEIAGFIGTITDITERKHAEEALKESEERLRILAEKTGTIVYDRDLLKNTVHREGAVETVLGYNLEEYKRIATDKFLNLIHDDDKEQFISTEKKILEQTGNFISQYRMKHKNGNFIFIEDNGIVITDEVGKPVRVLGSMRDITLKKLAEDELRKLSHAVEQSQVSIVITNKQGFIEYVNPKFCQVTGYSYEEAIGQNPNILKSGEWKSETYSGMWNDISSGRSWTGIFHNKKKSGELFWESAHISPIKNPEGEITHYIAVKEDITEKVKAEEELRRYREHLEEMVEERTAQVNSQNIFLRTLIETIPNPLFVKDDKGCYTEVNPAFEKFYGMKREDLIGKKLDVVLSGEARRIALETDEKLKKEQGMVSYEVIFEKEDGSKVPVIVYKSSFGISSNEPEGIMGMFIDISERKEMEEKTIQALNREKELNEMKTNFISMASHEFRTPLTTILASADLVEMYHSKWSPEKVLNHIKKIQDSVNYMTTLLDDVLTLSRADRGKLKFTPAKSNLREICIQILDEINYQVLPGHNIIFNYNLKEDIVNIDKKLLNQILNNLLSNAVKFSPDGGKIILDVSEKGNFIQFTVQDEGLGIDKNELKNIFEPFFRGKNAAEIHGSGLGLNIVKNAVELHGGEISIESALNKGTKFIFTIKSKD